VPGLGGREIRRSDEALSSQSQLGACYLMMTPTFKRSAFVFSKGVILMEVEIIH